MEISKEEFKKYVNCQMSGVTNMFDIKIVEMITGLDKEQILYVMKNYGTLKLKYGV